MMAPVGYIDDFSIQFLSGFFEAAGLVTQLACKEKHSFGSYRHAEEVFVGQSDEACGRSHGFLNLWLYAVDGKQLVACRFGTAIPGLAQKWYGRCRTDPLLQLR